MVCGACEKKLTKVSTGSKFLPCAYYCRGHDQGQAFRYGQVACPEKWKADKEKAGETGGRKVNENKLLTKSKR